MATDYAIDTADAGLSNADILNHWRDGMTPAGFVDWFSEKYGLIHRGDWKY